MWIILIILAASFNALWSSLSKRQLGKLSPFQFTLMFRALTALLLLPVFLYDFKLSTNPIFWMAVLGAGALEVMGIYCQSVGVKKDFYSTYSMSNTAPLFTLFIAPLILPEKINLTLVIGAISMVIGGVVFYRLYPKLSVYGLVRAISLSVSGILAKIAIGYSSGLTYPFITFTIAVWLMVLVSPFRQGHINWNLFKPFTKNLFPLALFSMVATICYYVAVQIAPITKVNPLMRTNLIFGFILSYFLLKERENLKRKIFASTLIVMGGILIAIS